MIDSLKIEKYIKLADKIFITAHKNIDLDALGSVFGMYYVASNYDKEIYIVIDDEEVTYEVKRALLEFKKISNVEPVRYNDIKSIITNKSLLIITDTNMVTRIQNKNMVNFKNKMIIDHHIETKDSITDATYNCIDTTSSSACEMVIEILKKLKVSIPGPVATIMLAGIYIDTNGFLLKTTEKTHQHTSLLYKFGADNIEAQYLLKQNYNEFKRRQKFTLNAEFYNNIVVSASRSKYLSTELAKASDVLLTFNNVEASFTIAKLSNNVVGISARSLGNIDVEEIMNHFGGGGHKTDAATQIKTDDVLKIKEELIEYIGGLNEGNIH